MADDHEGFAEWLKQNPEPSLQELAEGYGGYSKVPVEAWSIGGWPNGESTIRRRLREGQP
jgi:hypothetical protein